jgi:hypothetical protein
MPQPKGIVTALFLAALASASCNDNPGNDEGLIVDRDYGSRVHPSDAAPRPDASVDAAVDAAYDIGVDAAPDAYETPDVFPIGGPCVNIVAGELLEDIGDDCPVADASPFDAGIPAPNPRDAAVDAAHIPDSNKVEPDAIPQDPDAALPDVSLSDIFSTPDAALDALVDVAALDVSVPDAAIVCAPKSHLLYILDGDAYILDPVNLDAPATPLTNLGDVISASVSSDYLLVERLNEAGESRIYIAQLGSYPQHLEDLEEIDDKPGAERSPENCADGTFVFEKTDQIYHYNPFTDEIFRLTDGDNPKRNPSCQEGRWGKIVYQVTTENGATNIALLSNDPPEKILTCGAAFTPDLKSDSLLYSSQGNIVRVQLPDPSQNCANHVQVVVGPHLSDPVSLGEGRVAYEHSRPRGIGRPHPNQSPNGVYITNPVVRLVVPHGTKPKEAVLEFCGPATDAGVPQFQERGILPE